MGVQKQKEMEKMRKYKTILKERKTGKLVESDIHYAKNKKEAYMSTLTITINGQPVDYNIYQHQEVKVAK